MAGAWLPCSHRHGLWEWSQNLSLPSQKTHGLPLNDEIPAWQALDRVCHTNSSLPASTCTVPSPNGRHIASDLPWKSRLAARGTQSHRPPTQSSGTCYWSQNSRLASSYGLRVRLGVGRKQDEQPAIAARFMHHLGQLTARVDASER